MGFFSLFLGDQPALVKAAFEDVKLMLKNGHEMFAAATAHLLDNEILDIDLKALDDEINEREQHLRRTVLEHLTVEPSRELVFSLKLISIVHEAERIGDLAKTLSKTGDLALQPRLGPDVEPLREIRNRILRLFEQVRDGFTKEDESVAEQMMRGHDRLKSDITSFLKDLAFREDITPNEAVVYALSARMMSRVSSHLSNIASTVVCPFDQIRRSPSWIDARKEEV